MSLKGYHSDFYGVYRGKEEKERRRIAFLGLLMTRHGQGYIESMEDEEFLSNMVDSFVTPMRRAVQIAGLQGEECTPNEEELDGMVIADRLLIRLDKSH